MIEGKIRATLRAEANRINLPDDLMQRIRRKAGLAPAASRWRPWRWVAAALLALTLAGAVGWSRSSGAVIAVLQWIGAVRVKEQAALQERWDSRQRREFPVHLLLLREGVQVEIWVERESFLTAEIIRIVEDTW